jgi:phospholipid/cholesterol/gamma-HCH transport system ATP-binding protein
MSAVVEVRGLTIGWGDVTLVEDISFNVTAGEIFAILGGSGSGKSTLLRFLVGLEWPVKGEIQIAGVGAQGPSTGPPPFGVMFQEGALFRSMSLLENVELPLQVWTRLPRDDIRTIAAAKLELVGLGDAGHKLPDELSGGMVKRGAIARALALDPGLAFLDEPSAGLDPQTSASFDDLILTLSRSAGLTVVMVTHELGSIFHVVDRCILLDRATRSVLATGDPRELRKSADPRVREFFNPLYGGKERTWRPVRTT